MFLAKFQHITSYTTTNGEMRTAIIISVPAWKELQDKSSGMPARKQRPRTSSDSFRQGLELNCKLRGLNQSYILGAEHMENLSKNCIKTFKF